MKHSLLFLYLSILLMIILLPACAFASDNLDNAAHITLNMLDMTLGKENRSEALKGSGSVLESLGYIQENEVLIVQYKEDEVLWLGKHLSNNWSLISWKGCSAEALNNSMTTLLKNYESIQAWTDGNCTILIYELLPNRQSASVKSKVEADLCLLFLESASK